MARGADRVVPGGRVRRGAGADGSADTARVLLWPRGMGRGPRRPARRHVAAEVRARVRGRARAGHAWNITCND